MHGLLRRKSNQKRDVCIIEVDERILSKVVNSIGGHEHKRILIRDLITISHQSVRSRLKEYFSSGD